MDKKIKTTVLDYAILGLIRDTPLTGYRIRKFFEETALGNYSSSPGTIYPALKRLEKNELVEKTIQEDSRKSHFQITSKGISILKEWFIKPLEKKEVEKNSEELLLRFAFMETLIDKESIINFLCSFRDLLKNYLNELQEYYDQESHNMPLHGRLAFQHGIDSNKVTLTWCKKVLSQIS